MAAGLEQFVPPEGHWKNDIGPQSVSSRARRDPAVYRQAVILLLQGIDEKLGRLVGMQAPATLQSFGADTPEPVQEASKSTGRGRQATVKAVPELAPETEGAPEPGVEAETGVIEDDGTAPAPGESAEE